MAASSQDDFSGGLWIPRGDYPAVSPQSDFTTPITALLVADNVEYLPTGGVRGRRGYERLTTDASVRPGEISALHRFVSRETVGQALSDGWCVAWPGSNTDWTNPRAAEVADGDRARVGLGSAGLSDHLVRFMNLGGAPARIPSTATIVGVQFDLLIRQQSSLFPFRDLEVKLLDDNNVLGLGAGFVGTNEGDTVNDYDETQLIDVPLTFGGPTDTWGLGSGIITPELVNDPGFGVGYAVQQQNGNNILFVDLATITVYYTRPTITRFLVASVDGAGMEYEHLSGGVFTPVAGGSITPRSAHRPRLVSWPEKSSVFVFDGLNEVRRYDGDMMQLVDAGTGTLGLSPPKGPYAALHGFRIYATQPGELSYSVYACDVLNETVWRPENQFSVNDDRNGIITGLASFGDRLVVLKDTGLWAFYGDIEGAAQLTEFEKKHGCVAPDSVQVTPYGIVYLARDGLRITDGASVALLSDAIEPLFRDRLTDSTYSAAVGGYHPRKGAYYLCLDPENGSECFVLHRLMVNGEERLPWSRMTGFTATCFATFDTTVDNGEFHAGSVDGEVFQLDAGSTDLGTAIPVTITTAPRLFDSSRRGGRVYQFQLLMRRRGPYLGALIYGGQGAGPEVQFGDINALPEAIIDERSLYVSDKASFGRFFGFRISALEDGPDFELHRFDYDYRVQGHKVWRT